MNRSGLLERRREAIAALFVSRPARYNYFAAPLMHVAGKFDPILECPLTFLAAEAGGPRVKNHKGLFQIDARRAGRGFQPGAFHCLDTETAQ